MHILHTVFYRKKTTEWIFTKVLLLHLERGKRNEGNETGENEMGENEMGKNEMGENANAESIRNKCNNKVCDKKETRCSAIAERSRCRVRYSFRRK